MDISILKEKFNKSEESLQVLQNAYNKSQVLSKLGTVIEFARQKIMHRIDPNLPYDDKKEYKFWCKIKNTRQNDIDNAALELFGVNSDDWFYLSDDFYKDRNLLVHSRISKEEALDLLKVLPSEYIQERELLHTFIMRVYDSK